MGTHPIFESDFDCLTDMDISVEAIVHNLDPPAELTQDLISQVDSKSGKSLIELAVILGRVKFIEKLLKMKPDLMNSIGFSGYSMPYLACVWNKTDAVETLFKAGANFTVPDETTGNCARDAAIEAGYTDLGLFIDELIEAKNKAAAEKGNKKKGKK